MSTSASTQTMPTSQPFTILRIKRKRDDEAPDVLYVEPSQKGQKRRRSGTGVFQLAETIDATSMKSKDHERELTNRIANMANEPPIVAVKPTEDANAQSTTPMSRNSSMTSTSRMYRVVAKVPQVGRPLKCPPKVLSSKDIAASKFRILDAELTPSSKEEEKVDPEMEKFQNLLQDYLSLNETSSGILPALASKNSIASSSATSMSTSSAPDDYVYDIFVHRPTVAPDMSNMANVATISGLPSSSDDEYDTDTESEEGDEADEDSNAEDFYTHDYPEEESQSEDSEMGGSDMFHEDSEDDDFISDNLRWRD